MSAAIDAAAKQYRARGWAPLPLAGKKPTVGEGWPNFTADDNTQFKGNVGNLLGDRSNGLVDIDLDCAQAVALAPAMLPATESTFGRRSKPRSHWLYRCEPAPETRQFQTKFDGMLVEMRSTGAQTMFPPSIHPDSGERVEWASDGEPLQIDAEALLRAVSDLAGMSLLVRHWPAASGRYNAEGALTGALLRAGRSEEQVGRLLTLIQEHAGAAKDHPPAQTVRRFAEKLAADKPVPGLKKLREYLGDDVATKAADWLALRPHGGGVEYEERSDGTYWLTTNNKRQLIEVRLCNFTAQIIEVIERDDGSGEVERLFILKAGCGSTARVPAKDFDTMRWVTAEWGPWAAVEPSPGKSARLAHAIKALSEDVEKRVVYAHLGWRKIDGQLLYLHAGGAIGAKGPVEGYEVDPGGELSHYVLPPVRRLREAVLASLSMLDMGSAAVACVCAAYRAPTAEFFPIIVALALVGETGVFKSAIVGCAQAHWGAYWDGIHFPANWSCTANQLERMAFAAKDALLTADDFNPKGTQYEVSAMHSAADRVIRAQGNRSGRGRLNPDATFKPSYAPRGLLAITGEDLPRGELLRARLVAVRMAKGDIDKEQLTALQRAAADGLLAEAMAAFVQWLAQQAAGLPARLAAARDKIRQWRQGEIEHARMPDNLTHLLIGLDAFLLFAVEAGVIDAEEKEALYQRAGDELNGVIEQQREEQRAENPVEIFCGAIRELLASGKAHLRGPDGKHPETPAAYGWRYKTWIDDPLANITRSEWVEQGQHVGWIEGKTLWLLPTVAFAEVNKLLASGRTIAKSPQTLWKEFGDAGLIIDCEEGRSSKLKWFDKTLVRVLWLAAERVLERYLYRRLTAA